MTFDGDRVIKLELVRSEFDITTCRRRSAAHALQRLWLDGNQLTSVPAEIGQLTSLTDLWLSDNQLTSVPGRSGRSRRWRA